MKRRIPLWERLDLMEEPAPRQTLVELCGNGRVIVENHRGVLEYGREKIRVKTRFGSISILGNGLLLRKMCGQQLVITGSIASIHLEGEK